MSVWVKCEPVNGENSELSDEEIAPVENLLNLQLVESDKDWTNSKRRKNRYKPTKLLKCDHCDFTTVYKNSLAMHTVRHTNIKPYTCKQCDYATKYTSCLRRHMIVEHKCTETGEKIITPLKCALCDYTTLFKDNLNAHKRKHKSEKRYQCENCTYSTSYINNYKKHKKKHSKEIVEFKCDKCSFVTKHSGHIHRHLSQIHNEITEKAKKCEFCDFTTIVGWRLNIHKQRSRQNEVIKCVYCEYQTFYKCESKKHSNTHFKEIYTKNSHRNKHNNIQEQNVDETLSLNLGEQNPPSIMNQTNHSSYNINSYTNTSNYSQNYSNAEDFLPKELLNYTEISNELPLTYSTPYSDKIDKKNIQVLDSNDRERPFGCSHCNYISKFKATVQRHYQRHHTDDKRPYHCSNCDFKTKTKDQIALHNKRSASSLEMRCQNCDFTTNFKCQFVMHQRSHYTFKCELCNYTCKHKHEIEKHVRTIHMGTKHLCKYCDFKTPKLEALLCHEALHTGNKPFKCKLCDYQTVRLSLLDIHVRRYHSDLKVVKLISESKVQSLKVSVPPDECL